MPGGTTDAHANGTMGPNAAMPRTPQPHGARGNNPIIELAELSEAECPALPQQACELRVHEQVVIRRKRNGDKSHDNARNGPDFLTFQIGFLRYPLLKAR